MTDNEIIKALECCIGGYGVRNCDNCPNMGYGCIEVIPRIALDLINRQRAEIERLEHIRKDDEQLINSLNKCYKLAKSEAIKEFAQRLKKCMRLNDDCKYDCGQCCYGCKEHVPIIDDLVKEMTEEKLKATTLYNDIDRGFSSTDIGKTVFLTKEGAEKAIQALKGGNEK